jgi:flagellar protein FliJ
MKKFYFSLENVKQIRQRQADIEEAALSRLLLERAALEAEQRRIQEEQAAAERRVIEASALDAGELQALEFFRHYSTQQKRLLEARKAAQDACIEQQRARVLEARRNFRLLEKLREKRFAEWEKDFSLELENLASEAYLAQWEPRRRSRS